MSDPAPSQSPSTDHPHLGLREWKKLRTRRTLVSVARELIREKGLDATTVEEICTAAGVSRRTFFNYFDAKEDAALNIQVTKLPPSAVEIFTAGGPTGLLAQDISALTIKTLEYSPAECEDFKTALDLIAIEPRLVLRHIAWMEREQGRVAGIFAARLGKAPEDPHVVITMLAFTTLLRATIATWRDSGHEGQPSDHVAHTVRVISDALVPS